MRKLGFTLLIIGFLGLVLTFSMDTSVSSGIGGGRVHNIGLMNDKQNLLLVFAVLAIAGAIFAARGGAKTSETIVSTPALRKCPYCAESIQIEAKLCRHCGKDLERKPADPDPEVETLLTSLRSVGYVVDVIGNGRWRIASSSKQSLAYPTSKDELRAAAEGLLANVKR